MADDAGGGRPPDPFATAKANLRDTVKWLTATFAAMAAAVLAGASLSGISGATGCDLALALAGGGVGLICLFLATGLTLRLLTAETFYLGDIARYPEIRAHLDRHAADILPPEFAGVDAMLALRQQAIEDIRRNADQPQSQDYQRAAKFFASLEPSVARLVDLAHFELLRHNLQRSAGPLFALAVGALVGLGLFAVFAGAAKKAAPATSALATPSLSATMGAKRPCLFP
jgi:hypothetical protein